MHLTMFQLAQVRFNIEQLLVCVRSHRRFKEAVPADNELHLVFTDLDDYPVLDGDQEVNWYIATLSGLAVGLGFTTSLDLFRAYQSGFSEPYDPPLVERLVTAADQALVTFTVQRDAGAEPALVGLQQALAPFRRHGMVRARQEERE